MMFIITTSDEEDIIQLAVGEVAYILDQYGKKGILRITDLVASSVLMVS